jgi:hypothetical protein
MNIGFSSRTGVEMIRSLVFSAFLVTTVLSGSPVRGADLTASFAAIQPTLVFINCGTQHGTGFIVSSAAGQSFIVTARHVVAGAKRIDVNLNNDTHVTLEATVVKSDEDHDLAILMIRRGGLATARMGSDNPQVGTAIGIAGYPPTSIEFLNSQNELKPELQVGNITAVRLSGAVIQHSAPSESGDSGGPLFLADSGDVVGVVRGRAIGGAVGYVAAGGAALRALLQSANVSFDNGLSTVSAPALNGRPQSQNALILQDAPGANRICATRLHSGTFTQAQGGTMNGNLDYGTPVETALIAQLRTLFASEVTLIGDDPFGANPPSAQAIAQLTKNNNCVGLVRMFELWQVNDSGFGSSISATTALLVYDFRGTQWYSEKRSKDQKRFFVFGPTDVQSALNDLANQTYAAIAAPFKAQDGSAATNFARYGLPIVSGARKAFFTLHVNDGHVIVDSAPPFGAAAQAGLQQGDAIVSINGSGTAGLDQKHVDDLVTNGSDWDLLVHGADGRDVHVRFASEDIRWYLQHSPKT